MDERLFRDLIVGSAGSIIAAIVIFLGTYGFRFSSVARDKLKQQREQEVEGWRSGDATIRQSITNDYLFTILKHMLLANMFWVLGEGLPEFVAVPLRSERLYLFLFAFGRGLSLLFFFLGLSKVLRYVRIKSSGQ
jgi:hypothetical protein